MDPEFERLLLVVEDLAEECHHIDSNVGAFEIKASRAALWAAVVAYGDRRAEEARGPLVAAMREAVAILGHGSPYERMHVQGILAAALSPAPEGVELTPLYHTLMNDMIEEAPDA